MTKAHLSHRQDGVSSAWYFYKCGCIKILRKEWWSFWDLKGQHGTSVLHW